MRFSTTLLLLFILYLLPLKAGNSDESAFAGTHFVIGFMQNEVVVMHGGLTNKIVITAQEETKIEVYKDNLLINDFWAVPDTAYEYMVDYDFIFDKSEEIGTNLLEFKSEKPIVCYVFSSQLRSTDSYIAHPVNTWGKEYIVTSMGIDHYYPDETIPDSSTNAFRKARRPGEFLIIASEDSTNVYIRPSEPTEKDWSGSESQILLDKGEGYLVKAFPMYYGDNDLTGSFIKSDKPVGVLSGHVRASIPQRLMKEKDSKDHLVEMIYSIDRWSKKYISVPFEFNDPNTGDMFKVTSAYDSTIVNMYWNNKVEQFTLNGIGDFKTIDMIDKPVRWISNKPIQIAQLMSHAVDFAEFNKFFDPSMLILPSQDRMVRSMFFALPKYISEYFRYTSYKQFVAHKVGILMTKAAVQDIMINGTYINTIDSVEIKDIPGTSYYYTNLPIHVGGNKIETEAGYFAAWSYGYGEADSYAMTLGSSLTSFVSKDSILPEIKVTNDCGYIDGEITDFVGSEDGGLGSLIPIQTETDNYKFDITSNNKYRIEFTAEPENKLDDAQIALDYRDLAGNGGVYKYKYKGLKIEYHGDLGIPNTELGASSFAYYRLKNNSDTIRTIYSLNFYQDTRLSFELENGGTLPYNMDPGEELLVKIIFFPETNSEALEDSIFIRVDCNYMIRSRVKANVLIPALTLENLDFGKVLINTTKSLDLVVTNNGATDIQLENLDFIEYSSEFYIDTLGVFPYNLLKGEDLKLKVSFTPLETKNYEASLYFNNNKNISNSVILEGIGAAPRVESLEVNWGTRRVGSINDTTVYLKNLGNWQAKVSHDDTDINTHSDSNLDILEDLNQTVIPGDSIPFNFTFVPVLEENYEIVTINKINELPDSLFKIRLLGKPSLPTIEVKEIYIGQIFLDEAVSNSYTAMIVGGNENLHIKSIEAIEPINTEFTTDIEINQEKYHSPGSQIETDISFVSSNLGRRKQYYLIEHDALPNYEYKIDTLKIYADVIPRDTVKPEVNILASEADLCRTQDIVISVLNKGNVDFNVTDLEYKYEKEPYYYEPESFDLPAVVKKGSSLDFEISNITKDFDSNELNVFLTINDTIQIFETRNLEYRKITNNFKKVIPIESKIGANDTIHISGEIPSSEVDYFDLNFEFEYDSQLLNYLGKTIELILKDRDKSDTLKSEIIVLQNRIILKEPIEIQSKDYAREWSIILPFKVLYKNEKESFVNMMAEFSSCYSEIVEKIGVKVLPICIFDLLPIEINDKLPSVSINSRIVRDEIDMQVYVPDAHEVIIEFYDVTGAQISTNNGQLFDKGWHQVNLTVEDLPIGSYFLNVQYKNYNKKILFIKSI